MILKKELVFITNDDTLKKANSCISKLKDVKENDCVWYQIYFMDNTNNSKMKNCETLKSAINEYQKEQPFYKLLFFKI